MSIIKLENINKTYSGKKILNDYSLDIDEGEFVALTGPSGCGKSTLLNIIGLLEKFDNGNLTIDGSVNIQPNSKQANKILREKISYLFQNYALVDDETVEYNLNLALKYSCKRKEKAAKIDEALRCLGLVGYADKYIYTLSGGEQQRVAMARILLKPSKIILADEPTGSLDEKNRDSIIDVLKTLNANGKTIVLVTHDKYVASQCQRIVEL